LASDAATVLIVDDEALNRDLLEQELQDAGYRTVSAESGAQALENAARDRPDLILLDAVMQGLDGFATCTRLKDAEATRQFGRCGCGSYQFDGKLRFERSSVQRYSGYAAAPSGRLGTPKNRR
jgi:hypothetical protein